MEGVAQLLLGLQVNSEWNEEKKLFFSAKNLRLSRILDKLTN